MIYPFLDIRNIPGVWHLGGSEEKDTEKNTFLVRDSNGDSYSVYFDIDIDIRNIWSLISENHIFEIDSNGDSYSVYNEIDNNSFFLRLTIMSEFETNSFFPVI
uniref:Acetyl-CoA carboxylase beta subunit n=1 Tax=Allium ovalifolium var. leuconeurum TaxID=931135 RepID=A0A650CZ93_9ASPA|nr:acetyl-CoA carboxylase beta subunit [Allium ovalifolium var. leuconeurum]